jgi:hypothetical protein
VVELDSGDATFLTTTECLDAEDSEELNFGLFSNDGLGFLQDSLDSKPTEVSPPQTSRKQVPMHLSEGLHVLSAQN